MRRKVLNQKLPSGMRNESPSRVNVSVIDKKPLGFGILIQWKSLWPLRDRPLKWRYAVEPEVDASFAKRVEAIVRQIPPGRVMTYGQIAGLCGNARAARIVGGVAHFGDPQLPWQRVVNKSGGLAAGYPGGRAGHRLHLEAEGIEVSDEYQVNVAALLWSPADPDQTALL